MPILFKYIILQYNYKLNLIGINMFRWELFYVNKNMYKISMFKIRS